MHIQMINIVNWNQSPEPRYEHYLTWNRVRKISHWVDSFTVLYQVRLTKLMYMSYTMYIERKNIHNWFSDHYIIDYVTCLGPQGHSANQMTSLYQYLKLSNKTHFQCSFKHRTKQTMDFKHLRACAGHFLH